MVTNAGAVRGMTSALTLGQRVAWYRRRRGLSQDVLAGLVGRTPDWLSKVENDKILLDRLSVIKALADALDITIGDLLAEPSLLDWTVDSGRRTVPALREALMDYRQVAPLLAPTDHGDPPSLAELGHRVDELWHAYQGSRFGQVTGRLPALLGAAYAASRVYDGEERLRAHALLALTYHAAASTLTKLGEADLAWIASERGLAEAQASEDPIVIGSLLRSVTHSLLSNGRCAAAVQLTHDSSQYLGRHNLARSPQLLSVYGTLLLAGSVAASRADDRSSARSFLDEATALAWRLGDDRNEMWTAFGPTNVAIHRVTSAMELGDVQVALDLGPRIDTSGLPTERRIRHQLELAHALSARNRRDDALALVLDAERQAPEQVRYHFLSRYLVLAWIKQEKRKPPLHLAELAKRLRVT